MTDKPEIVQDAPDRMLIGPTEDWPVMIEVVDDPPEGGKIWIGHPDDDSQSVWLPADYLEALVESFRMLGYRVDQQRELVYCGAPSRATSHVESKSCTRAPGHPSELHVSYKDGEYWRWVRGGVAVLTNARELASRRIVPSDV